MCKPLSTEAFYEDECTFSPPPKECFKHTNSSSGQESMTWAIMIKRDCVRKRTRTQVFCIVCNCLERETEAQGDDHFHS